MRINGIVTDSIVDGYGYRYVIFLQGCKQKCMGCHNPDTWDPNGGYEIDASVFDKRFKKLKDEKICKGITISGGEPFLQVDDCIKLVKFAHKYELDVWVYTGYIYEDLVKDSDKKRLIDIIDYLVDGPYIYILRDLELLFRGSSNQRILKLKNGVVIDNED